MGSPQPVHPFARTDICFGDAPVLHLHADDAGPEAKSLFHPHADSHPCEPDRVCLSIFIDEIV